MARLREDGSRDCFSVPIEKSGGNNPPHPAPGMCTWRAQAAMKAGCCNEEAILQWCSVRQLNLSSTECRRVMKNFEQVEGSLNEQF